MEIEQDLAVFYGIDARDFYRPRGGATRLTIRRMLVLIDGLDRAKSRFWCAVTETDPVTVNDRVLMDIYYAITGQAHWLLTYREDKAKREKYEALRARALAEEEERIKRLRAIKN